MIAIVLGYVSVVHESTLFSAILITFICVGVTTLMIAMALQNPQKQVELEKSVSKVVALLTHKVSLIIRLFHRRN